MNLILEFNLGLIKVIGGYGYLSLHSSNNYRADLIDIKLSDLLFNGNNALIKLRVVFKGLRLHYRGFYMVIYYYNFLFNKIKTKQFI